MLSDVVLILIVAYVLLLVVAYTSDIPFVYIVAGMVAIFLAIQAYNDTGEAVVGMSLGSLGVITLLGGLNEVATNA